MEQNSSENIYEIIQKRRSVRSFREDPISDDVLKRILGAGQMAPSANNSQEYKFIVVKGAEKRKALAKAAAGQRFIAEAPVIIAGVALNPDYLMENKVPAYAVDLSIAIDHMTLAAVMEDLGTCWIGDFYQEEAKEVLKIPPQYKIVALLPLGTPYDEPGVKSRKKLGELVCEEEFME